MRSDNADVGPVLPYRTDREDLVRWVEARARGSSAAQLRERAASAKALEGTAVAAEAFGLWDRERDRLTSAGERLALAGEAERVALLERAVRAYEPYRRLLEAVAERADGGVTDVQWIETWWATRGYGSSQSNRAEGAAVLGRLVEQLGLGRYIPGRRGHPTRIEWVFSEPAGVAAPRPDGDRSAAEPPAAPVRADEPSGARAGAGTPEQPIPPHPGMPEVTRVSAATEYNRVVVPLTGGAEARLVVPQRLHPEEKRRLLTLLDLLISER